MNNFKYDNIIPTHLYKKKQLLFIKLLRKKLVASTIKNIKNKIKTINKNLLKNSIVLYNISLIILLTKLENHSLIFKKVDIQKELYNWKSKCCFMSIKLSWLVMKLNNSLWLKWFNNLDIINIKSITNIFFFLSSLNINLEGLMKNVYKNNSIGYTNRLVNSITVLWNAHKLNKCINMYYYVISVFSSYKVSTLLYRSCLLLTNQNNSRYNFAHLPTSRSKITLIRSPHIDKKSREQFEKAVHLKVVSLPFFWYSLLDNIQVLKDIFYIDSLVLFKALLIKKNDKKNN
jgi:hypothetical protein